QPDSARKRWPEDELGKSYTATGGRAVHRMHELVSEPAMGTHDSLVKQFLNYLRAERHFSAHTARCYAADLEQFRGYLVTGELPMTGPRAGGTNGHSHKPAAIDD